MKLLTIEQTAEMLSVHANTVRAMLAQLGAVDLNRGTKGKRLIRIPECNVNTYIRDCAILPKMTQKRRERRRA